MGHSRWDMACTMGNIIYDPSPHWRMVCPPNHVKCDTPLLESPIGPERCERMSISSTTDTSCSLVESTQ